MFQLRVYEALAYLSRRVWIYSGTNAPGLCMHPAADQDSSRNREFRRRRVAETRVITQKQLRIDRATSWPSTLHEFMHEVNALGMVHSVAPFLFLISTTRHGWCDEMLMPDVCCSWCLLSFYCWTSAKCWTMGFFSHFCGLLIMVLVRALSGPCLYISMA